MSTSEATLLRFDIKKAQLGATYRKRGRRRNRAGRTETLARLRLDTRGIDETGERS